MMPMPANPLLERVLRRAVATAGLLLLISGLLRAAEKPVLAWDLTSAHGAAVPGRHRPEAGLALGQDVRVEQDGPVAGGALRFPGTADGAAAMSLETVAEALSGEEVTVRFWFRIEEAQNGELGFGFTLQKHWDAPCGVLRFRLGTKPTKNGSYGIYSGFDRKLVGGAWHHIAFVYSLKARRFTAWLDGRVQSNYPITSPEPAPLSDWLRPLGQGVKGRMAGIEVYNRALAPEAVLQHRPTAAALDGTAQALAAARDKAGHVGLRAWTTAMAAEVKAIRAERTCSVGEWQRLQDACRKLPPLQAWTAKVTTSSPVAEAPLLCLSIDPFDSAKRLPHVLPHDGVATDTLKVVVTPSEYESVSFVLFPFQDLPNVQLEATTLEAGPQTLPAETVDLKVVKCWHAPSSSWNSYFAGGREFPTLIPELLLHDDGLVRVDEGARRNYLRVDYKAGSRYIDISRGGSKEAVPSFNYVIEPVQDSATLRPLPLKAGKGQQFWLTVHPPANTPAGVYTGRIRLATDSRSLGELRLVLRVLPFALPRPMTRYDPDREFMVAMMNHCGLGTQISLGRSQARAEARLLAELRNMVAHNVLHPFGPSFDREENEDWTKRQIELMQEAGMPCRPIFGGGMATDVGYYVTLTEQTKADLDMARDRFRVSFDRRMARADAWLGHRDIYFAGIDEAGAWGQAKQFPFFAMVREAGARIFVTSGSLSRSGFAVDANDHPAEIDRHLAARWHAAGARLFSYAAPFTGPENPETWRRTKGMRLYQADYDGLAEYIWYEGHNLWNEFVWAGRYKNFNIVYPTYDGVIDTVAWEALREALDDVRYATLLRQRAGAAMAAQESARVRLGKEAMIWLELVDPETVDLRAMRTGMVEWLLKLHPEGEG